jgi:hypothetical protein
MIWGPNSIEFMWLQFSLVLIHQNMCSLPKIMNFYSIPPHMKNILTVPTRKVLLPHFLRNEAQRDEKRTQNFCRKTLSNHSEDLGADGRIILERFLEKRIGKVWTGCIWLRTGASGGLL